MRKKLTIIILVICTTMLACKVKSTTDADQSTSQATKTYDYRVSFNSQGAGIDLETFRNYKAFLESYTPSVDYTKVSWGKEGEKGFCINLSSWDNEAAENFKTASSKILDLGKNIEINGIDRCN